MDRKEWLKKLQMELYRMPRNEIDDAVAYYSEYFEEAGPENEQEIIRELGDPSKVAAQIKADYAVRQLDDMEREEQRGERRRFWNRRARSEGGDYGQYGGNERRSESWQEHVGNAGYSQQEDGWQNAQSRQAGYRDGYNNGYTDAKQAPRGRVGLVIAAIIGGILAAPIALPVAFVLIGLAIAGICVVGAIIIGLIALAVGGVVGGIAILISAFFTAGTTAAGMMIIIGTGLALAGGSILLGFLVIKGAAALTRAIARGISNRRARKQMAGGYNPGAYQNNEYQYSTADDGFAPADGWTESNAQAEDFAESAAVEPVAEEAAEAAAAEEADAAEIIYAAESDSPFEESETEAPAAPETEAAADIPAADGEVNEDAGK